MMGLEPTTFCMASRRSSQLSYIREVAGVYRARGPLSISGGPGGGCCDVDADDVIAALAALADPGRAVFVAPYLGVAPRRLRRRRHAAGHAGPGAADGREAVPGAPPRRGRAAPRQPGPRAPLRGPRVLCDAHKRAGAAGGRS